MNRLHNTTMKHLPMIFLLVILPALLVQGLPQADIAGLVGDTMLLPCEVDTDKCGELHSIKWYRGSSRIYVFSEMAKIARAEGEYVGRAELHYTTNMSRSHLELRQLHLADEAVYKCEITFLEVREGCAVVQFVNLTALIKPEYVKILKDDDTTEIETSTLIGPFTEGHELKLSCKSGGGKPIADVTWWNGTEKLPGAFTAEPEANGVGTGVSRLQVSLGRGDLGAKFECRAASRALDSPLIASVEVDVNVRPLRLDLTGVEEHVLQGTEVLLSCQVTGARPAANITWYNSTEPMTASTSTATSDVAVQQPSTKIVEATDGTYTTQSELRFKASRHENGGILTCEASNPVLQDSGERPLRDTVTLEVLYPPIVTVSPENITVNESTDILLFCKYDANPSILTTVQWFRDNQPVVLDNGEHFDGGKPEDTTLLIKNATRHDQGAYSCVLENSVGRSESPNLVYVSIYYKPTVSLVMEPTTPVSETERLNITLVCSVEQGNPPTLLAVRWYLDGELLKQLPDCGSAPSPAPGNDSSTFCDIDPSKLLLEFVGRSFHGNYSCEGMNEAGWGPLSSDEELVVYYPPGPASLVFEPTRVIKRSSVTLSCTVDDLGRPEATAYRWLRGQHPIHDVTSANLTIDPVTLETESNFTCLAYNAGGDGEGATVFIEVFAPPAFIERLPPYHGALMNAEHISLSCRVECSPACGVRWLKDGHPIPLGMPGSRYTVKATVLPPDSRTNDFESVVSSLSWDMSAWPNAQLDRIYDNANYTCESSGNEVGPGVKSTTFFGVEYPPENVSVSVPVLSVVEGHIPEKILCNAKAYPEPSYQWHRENDTEIIMKGNALILNYPIPRTSGGNYVCEAFNRHGNITHKTFINVLHKPECAIKQREMEGKLVLICNASANPTDVDFTWRIKNENETIEENVETKGLVSYLTLETRVENFRTYLCFANNSVGMSIPCERDITDPSWWASLDNDHKLMIASIITGALLMVIIVCIIIIIVCRRKRVEDKYNNTVELEERENPEGDSSLTPPRPPPPTSGSASMTLQQQQPQSPNAPTAVHRWPLKPGVHVHVNGARSLVRDSPTQSSPQPSSSSADIIRTSTPLRPPSSVAQQQLQQYATPVVGTVPGARQSRKRPGQALRREQTGANLVANMARGSATVYPSNLSSSLPRVNAEESGVVTLKKLDGTMVQVQASRKRKKPGKGPNPSDMRDKSNQDPSGDLDGDRSFYENLPFHGIAPPPNKPSQARVVGVTPSSTDVKLETTSTPCSPSHSRPESPLSRHSSSGYGSTRSKPEASKNPASSVSSNILNSVSNPNLDQTPQLSSLPNITQNTLPRVQGRKTQMSTPSDNFVITSSQTLPRVQGRQSQRSQVLLPLSEPKIFSNNNNTPLKHRAVPPIPIPKQTVTLQKTEKVITTVSIQNITPKGINIQNINPNILVKKRKPPPPPTKPKPIKLIPLPTKKIPEKSRVTTNTQNTPSTSKSNNASAHAIPLPCKIIHTPTTSSVNVSKSSAQKSNLKLESLPSITTNNVTQFYSLRKPKEKITITQFYSLRRCDGKQLSKLLNSKNTNIAKSTPNIYKSQDLKTPIPTPRKLKNNNIPISNTSTPLSKSKPIYQNVPIRISPNSMQQDGDLCDSEPYKPEFSDLDYADVDYRSYGPINYKAASVVNASNKSNTNNNNAAMKPLNLDNDLPPSKKPTPPPSPYL